MARALSAGTRQSRPPASLLPGARGTAATARPTLRRELSAIRGMARQALRDRPQLLEKLGITARTSKTAAQRGAGKKAATTRQANKASAAPPGM